MTKFKNMLGAIIMLGSMDGLFAASADIFSRQVADLNTDLHNKGVFGVSNNKVKPKDTAVSNLNIAKKINAFRDDVALKELTYQLYVEAQTMALKKEGEFTYSKIFWNVGSAFMNIVEGGNIKVDGDLFFTYSAIVAHIYKTYAKDAKSDEVNLSICNFTRLLYEKIKEGSVDFDEAFIANISKSCLDEALLPCAFGLQMTVFKDVFLNAMENKMYGLSKLCYSIDRNVAANSGMAMVCSSDKVDEVVNFMVNNFVFNQSHGGRNKGSIRDLITVHNYHGYNVVVINTSFCNAGVKLVENSGKPQLIKNIFEMVRTHKNPIDRKYLDMVDQIDREYERQTNEVLEAARRAGKSTYMCCVPANKAWDASMAKVSAQIKGETNVKFSDDLVAFLIVSLSNYFEFFNAEEDFLCKFMASSSFAEGGALDIKDVGDKKVLTMYESAMGNSFTIENKDFDAMVVKIKEAIYATNTPQEVVNIVKQHMNSLNLNISKHFLWWEKSK